VKKLERIRIMNITLKGLPVGDWRALTDNEIQSIYGMLEDSFSDDIKKTKTQQKPENKGSISKKANSRKAPQSATKKEMAIAKAKLDSSKKFGKGKSSGRNNPKNNHTGSKGKTNSRNNNSRRSGR
jgi:23S rRNA pseudouridine2604 synthase